MPSKNATSADNQQERLKFIGWIVGFVDGEGTFSVSLIRNKTTKSGWQIFPEFVVTQGEKSLKSLETMQEYFDCGNIFINRRNDNHKENLYRYCVRSIKELDQIIIPFFTANQLRTAKREDFILFCRAIKIIKSGSHLHLDGRKRIMTIAQKMNRKKSRKL